MRLVEVVLTNFGPFQGERAFKFKNGTVGVFGPNGSGKTTLMDAAYAVLTNDFGRFDGDRADCRNRAAGPDAVCSVAVRLEHDGAKVRLSQTIAPKPKFEFQLNKDKPLTQRAAADDAMARLGFDKKLMAFCAFKRQPGSEKNAINDFLRTTPTARAEAYSALNQTQHCGVVYEVLGDVLARDRAQADAVVDDTDELAAAHGEAKAEADRVAADRKKAAADLMKPEHAARAKEVVAKTDRLESVLRGRLVTLGRAAEAAEEDEAEVALRVSAREADLATARAKADAAEARAAKSADLLSKLAQLEKAKTRLRDADLQLNALKAEEGGKLKPECRYDADAAAQAEERLNALKEQLKTARRVLDVLGKKGCVACPTCGQSTDGLADYLDDLRRVAEEGPAEAAACEAVLAEYRAYQEDARRYDKWQAAHAERLTAAVAARKRANEDVLPFLFGPVDPDQARKTVAEAEAARKEAAEADAKLRTLQVAHARRQQDAKNARAALAACEAEVAESTFPAEVVARARTRLKEHTAAEVAVAALDGKLEGLNRRAADALRDLEAARARVERGARLREVVAVLTRVRDGFHPKRLPQRVAEANLALMEGDINANLAMLGDPFWVETTPGLSFSVHKPGEPPHAAERLSGGQQAVLAGSCSQATRGQVAHWLAQGRPALRLDPMALSRGEPQAEQALAAVGLLRDDANAQLSVLVGFQGTQYLIDPWGYRSPRPYYGSIAIGQGAPWGSGVGFGMGMRFPPTPQYRREVSLILRDLKSGQVVYETRASHDGPWSDSTPIFATLFKAALANFPNPPAGPQRVNIEIPR